MCKDESFNGWTNRETWSLMLYVNNDEGWQAGARDALDSAEPAYVNAAADTLKDWAEGFLTVDGYAESFGEPMMPTDLVRIAQEIGSLDRVDWRECARSILDDINEAAKVSEGNWRVTFSTESEDLTWHEVGG